MARFRIPRVDGSTVLATPSRLVQRQGDDSAISPGAGNGNNGQGNQTKATGDGTNPTIIIITVVVIALVVAVCLYLVLRICRSRNADPRYLPTPLKKLWTRWNVGPHHSSSKYSRTGDADDDGFNRRSRMRNAQTSLEDALQDVTIQRNAAATVAAATAANTTPDQDGVNRNTSVRSVMTLPAYRPTATDTEQVLGREGERGGIDTVVELPTAEDEEALREEEMNALYQIRLARRRQIAEREERREERRLARERQDHRALADIRTRARVAAEQAHREVDGLRESHDAVKQSRTRAVSSVSYADVGLVRADGTRLRASSNASNDESERMGLLSDAGSISLSNTRESRRSSLQHRRAPSSQSVLSIDTVGSNSNSNINNMNNNAAGSRSGSPGMAMVHHPRTGSAMSQRAGSSPELIDAAEARDSGDSEIPPLHSPPGYDDVSLEDFGQTSPYSNSANNISNTNTNTGYNYNSAEQQQQQQQPPPPEYESPTQKRQKRLSAHMADLAATTNTTTTSEPPTAGLSSSSSSSSFSPPHTHARASSRGVGGIPQLPSLRLHQLPQIVIEPSSAVTPSRDHIDEEP